MSVRATIGLELSVVETVAADAGGFVSSTRNSVTVNGGNVSEALTGATTPPVTAHAFGTKAMTAGAATLDLRSLTGLNGAAVDLNGLKPRAILLCNPDTNANDITVEIGASNGYTGMGAAFSETLKPGESVLRRFGAAGVAVSNTVKTLDITGTGTQALEYQIVAGV